MPQNARNTLAKLGRADRRAVSAHRQSRQPASRHGVAIVALLTIAHAMPSAASANKLFAGEWGKNCADTIYTFHDGDKVKIVDLWCRIVAWKQDGNRYTSDLKCVLDGVPSNDRIEVETMGKQLRITMGGLSQVVKQCP